MQGLEQNWLAQCQYNVTGWCIMFICGILLTTGIKAQLESGPDTADLTATVVYCYKLLRNDVNPLTKLIHFHVCFFLFKMNIISCSQKVVFLQNVY